MAGSDIEPTQPATVAEALAVAEGWNERAAILATLADEVTSLFGSDGEDQPPAYLVQRIAGGTTAVNPQVVAGIRGELLHAVEHARGEARRILGSATDARVDGLAPCLGGEGALTPIVSASAMKVPTGGDEITGNPECPRARRTLGATRQAAENNGGAEPVSARLQSGPGPARQVRGPLALKST